MKCLAEFMRLSGLSVVLSLSAVTGTLPSPALAQEGPPPGGGASTPEEEVEDDLQALLEFLRRQLDPDAQAAPSGADAAAALTAEYDPALLLLIDPASLESMAQAAASAQALLFENPWLLSDASIRQVLTTLDSMRESLEGVEPTPTEELEDDLQTLLDFLRRQLDPNVTNASSVSEAAALLTLEFAEWSAGGGTITPESGAAVASMQAQWLIVENPWVLSTPSVLSALTTLDAMDGTDPW